MPDKRERRSGCGSGVTLFGKGLGFQSLACGRSHYDRSDESGGYRGENIISVYLAPFIAVWRLVEMILTIVHSFATLPVFIMHLEIGRAHV